MTVESMTNEMTSAELVEWQAYDELRHAEQETAQRQADKGMKAR